MNDHYICVRFFYGIYDGFLTRCSGLNKNYFLIQLSNAMQVLLMQLTPPMSAKSLFLPIRDELPPHAMTASAVIYAPQVFVVLSFASIVTLQAV